MFGLVFVKQTEPEPITEGFVLYGSTFPDVNGHYTRLPLGEYEYYDALAEELISEGKFKESALEGTGGLNYIEFNGKTYILDGGDGMRIIPINGDGVNNWYYYGGGAGAVAISDFYVYDDIAQEYINQNDWIYNVSPGTTSNPQYSQDWTQHIFPHVQFPENN